jgi:hypothetical protein
LLERPRNRDNVRGYGQKSGPDVRNHGGNSSDISLRDPEDEICRTINLLLPLPEICGPETVGKQAALLCKAFLPQPMLVGS